MRIVLALLRARNKEFIWDRATLSWNLLFPFLMILGLAFVFSEGGRPLAKVGLFEGAGAAVDLTWLEDAALQTVPLTGDRSESLEAAKQRVERHQLDLLLAPPQYWINEDNPKGRLLERALQNSTPRRTETAAAWQRVPLEGQPVRYVDWFLPGALGMNMLFSCLFGVGYVIVRYRKAGILRRLSATPIHPWQFLIAQVLSRLWLVLLVNVLLYLGCDLLLDFRRVGSLGALFIVLCFGSFCLIALSILLCSAVSSQELAGGLLNLGTWPMMLLSEVWFSLDGAHPALFYLSQALPLTHIVVAARAVMIDGATLAQIAPQLGLLALLTLAFLTLGGLLFRWN